jgi:hypothetical protein
VRSSFLGDKIEAIHATIFSISGHVALKLAGYAKDTEMPTRTHHLTLIQWSRFFARRWMISYEGTSCRILSRLTQREPNSSPKRGVEIVHALSVAPHL